MIQHYLKIALRNILKYKVQNLVSVLSIAASATLLTVVSSLFGEFHSVEMLDKPYADRVVQVSFRSPEDNPDIADWEIMERAMSEELQSVEKCFVLWGGSSVCEVTATVGGQERTLQTSTHVLAPGLLNWWGVRSVVTGGACAELVQDKGMEPGAVVMTEQTARRLFGRIDVTGETIDLVWLYNVPRDHHTLRVANVVKPSPFDPFHRTSGIYVADSLRRWSDVAYVQLREGRTKADLEAELADRLKDTSGTFMAAYIRDLYSGDFRYITGTFNGILAFLTLFLGVCVVGYMRMQAQLFRIRQREIALRTVVGARRWQLHVQFSVEVLLILALALMLTLAINTFVRSFLLENFSVLYTELDVRFTDLTQRTLCIFAVVAALCLATVALVIRSIRRRQTGLAMMMRPSRHSFASVATMSVQLFFSTFLMAALVMLFSFVNKDLKRYNIPANDDFYNRCIVVNNIDDSKMQQLKQLIEKSGNVERVFRFNESGDRLQVDEDESAELEYHDIDFQEDREMFDFYGVQPVVTNPRANPAKCVYVPRVMMERMKQGGTWQRGYIDIMLQRYDIAGYFDQLPYTTYNDRRIIATDADRFAYYTTRLVVAARPRRYNAAMQDIADAHEQVFPGNLSLNAYNYRTNAASQAIFYEVLQTLFAIVAAISLVTTVASIYSVISLDTRRRRKEVALRKVHGATASIIGWMFARRYVLICSACYLLLLPALLLIFSIPGSDSFGITWWQAWLLTSAIITGIVALTVGWKIWEVMHVKPAEWLKE